MRFLKIVDDFSKDPTASIPEASGGWAASKAAYRFFDNPAVRPDDIRDALRRDALEYLPPDGPILAIQDTTSLDFTDHPATAGLGYMEHPKHSGLFMHSVLAATPEGVPCGIIDQRTWARDPAGLGKRSARRTRRRPPRRSRGAGSTPWRPPRPPCRRGGRSSRWPTARPTSTTCSHTPAGPARTC